MTTAGRGPWRDAFRRLSADKWAIAAMATLLVFTVAAVAAPLIAPHNPDVPMDIVALKNQPPSVRFPFGTDEISRDVLSRVLFGGRVSLAVGFLAAVAATLIGTAYGAVSGYAGGALDAVMMRAVDACLAIPRLLLLLTVLALWGRVPTPVLILVIALTGWFGISRIIRGQVISVREREYISAALALGARDLRVLVRHILPNVMSQVIVLTTLAIGEVILLEAGLSFIGIGIQPPEPSWGNIMQSGADHLVGWWWLSVFPGLAILLTVASVNVLGDRLRDALDPRELPRR